MQGPIPIPNSVGGHTDSSRIHAILDGLEQSKAIVASSQSVTRAQLETIKSEMQRALFGLRNMEDDMNRAIERLQSLQRACIEPTHPKQKVETAQLDVAVRSSQNHTQKTATKPRDKAKRNNNVHSERSVRSNDRKALTDVVSGGNPLDIWVMSAPLFRPIPTEEDLNEVCRMVLVDHHVDTVHSKTHWSERMRQIVVDTQKDVSKKILLPPGPPPAPDDIAHYWTRRSAPFPMEDIQRQNSSVMHCLLNAFVDAKPLPKSDCETRDFMPTHVLLPRIEFDEYLNRSFEDRLALELKSAGLEKPVGEFEGGDSPLLAQEIEQFKEELEKLRPEIERMQMEIVERLPEMREIEERRAEELRKYEEIKRRIKPETKRNHKK